MLYEFRSYEAAEGKLDALNARFRDVTWPLLKKYGFEQVGFFLPEAPNQLVYVLRWPDRATAEERWKAFRADPEWIAKREASEVDGPLAAHITSQFWHPTDYSELK